jgi:alkaline phosphatase
MKRYIHIIIFILVALGCTKDEDPADRIPTGELPEVKKNIILFIGDGMALSQITAARTANNDQLNMLRCNHIGLQSTHSADEYVTDSGASATAMACGEKTNYYTVGVNVNGDPITSIVELAENKGMATSILTTSTLVHATPAAFYAHHTDRFAYEDIALQLIQKDIDFLVGGGKLYFEQRTDGLNLLDSLAAKKYEVVESLDEVSGTKKATVFIAYNHPTRYVWGRGDVLGNSLEMALSMYKNKPEGFFILVEGAHIDWAGEENDQSYLISEMLDFDRTVGIALDFAEAHKNTLVIVTGDHETGGYTLLDGDLSTNSVAGEFLTDKHTGTMIPVFSYGPGSKEFIGVYENSEIFYKMKSFLDLD